MVIALSRISGAIILILRSIFSPASSGLRRRLLFLSDIIQIVLIMMRVSCSFMVEQLKYRILGNLNPFLILNVFLLRMLTAMGCRKCFV